MIRSTPNPVVYVPIRRWRRRTCSPRSCLIPHPEKQAKKIWQLANRAAGARSDLTGKAYYIIGPVRVSTKKSKRVGFRLFHSDGCNHLNVTAPRDHRSSSRCASDEHVMYTTLAHRGILRSFLMRSDFAPFRSLDIAPSL
jgi:hypothetical protein